MKPIPFFTDTIRIRPHTATDAEHIGRPVSLREFAGNGPVALYELDNGELRAECGYLVGYYGGARDFIEGPEAV